MRNFKRIISFLLVLVFTIGIQKFEYTNAKNNNIYEPLKVSWSRTVEPNSNVKTINTMQNNGADYWSNRNIDGKSYKVLDKYPGNNNVSSAVIETYKTAWGQSLQNNVVYDYDTLVKLLEPKETKRVWDGRTSDKERYYSGYINDNYLKNNNYPVKDFSTWKHYGSGESLRMFRGEFEIPKDMTNKKVYLGVLGENGPELIMPVNDIMMVLVNGKSTDINFSTQSVRNKNFAKLQTTNSNGDKVVDDLIFKQGYHKHAGYANCTKHNNLTTHTDTWHAHLNEGNEEAEFGDITSYLDKNKATQKIEIIAGDNTGGGGSTKLDVFVVDLAKINVTKAGYLIKDGHKININNDEKLYPGEEVYYKFNMKNDGKEVLTDLLFEDELIDILIRKDGVYRKSDMKKLDSSKVEVARSSEDEMRNSKGTGMYGLELLQDLRPNESIEVLDLNNIKYEIKPSDVTKGDGIVNNIVKGKAFYLNGNLQLEEYGDFRIEAIDSEVKATITKDTHTIIRDGKEIYNSYTDLEKEVPEIEPNDKVSFVFDIGNKTTGDKRGIKEDLPLNGLSLDDVLSDEYKNTLVKGSWNYEAYKLNKIGGVIGKIEDFNSNNFKLGANEKIRVIGKSWTVPEQKKDWTYDVTNTIYLNRNSSIIAEDSTDLKITRPHLYIKKDIVNGSLQDSNINRTFSIKVKGDDGSLFNIEATPSKYYKLSNLKYGVNYKVEEIVPINYELVGFDIIKGKYNDEVISSTNNLTVSSSNSGNCVVVKNKKVNDKYFYDESSITNRFNYKPKEDVISEK
ncbi:MAG: hypothetical protein ACRCVJ_11045 [Clostridium sp.]|uniref:hypothetical protein n=1 Tax=Clostridium sp. TaxID=1506 RepID=UPI003F30D2E7